MNERFKKIFDLAIQHNASDIHFQQNNKPVLRVGGRLVQVQDMEPLNISNEEGLSDYLNQLQQDYFKEHGSVDFAFDYGQDYRFRGSLYKQHKGMSLSLRLLRDKILSFDELNLPSVFKAIATQYHQGFFLIVGPTGQGKSTSLATVINHINQSRESHIITIEDPIEYIFQNQKSLVEQREVGTHASSFSNALRAAMRQDPDVIMIGEMRDLETIQAAVTLAETGHLVFSTMHTNDAVQTIDRIIDAFPQEKQKQVRIQLASALSGVISQRLVPDVNNQLILAHEVMLANDAIRNIIRTAKTEQIYNAMQTDSPNDKEMLRLEKCLAQLVKEQKITKETAYTYASNRELVDVFLQY